MQMSEFIAIRTFACFTMELGHHSGPECAQLTSDLLAALLGDDVQNAVQELRRPTCT